MSQRIVESAHLRYKILRQVCRQFYVVLHVLNYVKLNVFVLFCLGISLLQPELCVQIS